MFQRFKNFRKLRKWYVVKLKLVDARLYFVSIFVGLLTGLVAVPYHYCLSLVSGKLLLRIRKYLINNIFRGQTPVHDLKCLHLQSVS